MKGKIVLLLAISLTLAGACSTEVEYREIPYYGNWNYERHLITGLVVNNIILSSTKITCIINKVDGIEDEKFIIVDGSWKSAENTYTPSPHPDEYNKNDYPIGYIITGTIIATHGSWSIGQNGKTITLYVFLNKNDPEKLISWATVNVNEGRMDPFIFVKE